MKVKVCGITRVEDALQAERLGADYIGMIFVKESKRCVSPQIAKNIASKLTTAIPVGVFVEQTDQEIEAIASDVGLKAAQVYRTVDHKINDLIMLEAVRVKSKADLAAIAQTVAHYVLFDAYHDTAHGGTGQSFDWGLLPENLDAVFLAGGLCVNNVKQAVALRPYAIDVCSGIECSPGIKDQEKMIKFFEELSRC